MAKNFTFKRQPREAGLRAMCNPYPDVDIKLDGKVVGWISSPTPSLQRNEWSIWFHVKANEADLANNPNCSFKNVCLKARFPKEEGAREFLKASFKVIVGKLQLHSME